MPLRMSGTIFLNQNKVPSMISEDQYIIIQHDIEQGDFQDLLSA